MKYQISWSDHRFKLLTDKEMIYDTIAGYIKEYTCEYLKSFRLVDIFEDEKLLPGKKM